MMKYNFPILPPLFLAALLALCSCIPLTHCTDEPPVAPPDTTTPPPPRDTTSHEFTWELHKIGATYGQMKDIWAINDDHAIAVGKFIWLDSSGSDYSITNLVELQNGVQTHSLATWKGNSLNELDACFATSSANIWLGSGIPLVFNDSGCVGFKANDVQRPPWGGIVRKMWGPKNTDYVYLTCGNVIQRVKDGKIKTIVVPEDHPEITFYDIWGEEDGDVLALGNDYSILTCYIYLIKPDDSWKVIHQSPAVLDGIWGYAGKWYFGDWGSLIEWDGTKFRTVTYGLGNPYRVRGNHENDIFISYQNCHVLHWNGSTWEDIYHDEFDGITATGISVTENAVYFCGIGASQQPVILVGKRKKH